MPPVSQACRGMWCAKNKDWQASTLAYLHSQMNSCEHSVIRGGQINVGSMDDQCLQ